MNRHRRASAFVMTLRRNHRKSRHGCLQCKRRRVKVCLSCPEIFLLTSQCDETRPTCSNCSSRQLACQYASSSSIIWTNEEPGSQSASSNPEALPPEPDLGTGSPFGILGKWGEDVTTAAPTDLNLTDLELMVQWCNSTYETISRSPRLDRIWRSHVTEEALSQPFLMHGVLAVSALHLAHTGADDRRPGYISTAVAHQNQALALFRALLGDINPANAKAMFCFASLVVVYAFGFPHVSDSDPASSVNDLYQVFVLSRGVQQVIHQVRTSLLDSPFRTLLQLDEYTPRLPDGTRLALDKLKETNHACGVSDTTHDTAAYESVVDNLAEELGAVHVGIDANTAACRWAIRLKPAYMESLREHRPLALVVLAHYCVLLYQLRQNWCLDRWGARVARAIWSMLDHEWRPMTDWPMREIFGPP